MPQDSYGEETSRPSQGRIQNSPAYPSATTIPGGGQDATPDAQELCSDLGASPNHSFHEGSSCSDRWWWCGIGVGGAGISPLALLSLREKAQV